MFFNKKNPIMEFLSQKCFELMKKIVQKILKTKFNALSEKLFS